MGKKGTKRKTRWRALPLGEDDAGSGNEEEFLDEDQSTTSSVIGHSTSFKVHPSFFRMGEKSYRAPRRFPYDRFREKEPLIKLESKTFDEEEYTKITTPRQDVLFKKGYFGRKRESSVEETATNAGELEGEEPMMDQYIITNGFLDERGHYYVNGSSYAVYDSYSNMVTVVVGPPPYTNGLNQPVLAAVSCQPVPLTPVEWYSPNGDWPSHGSAWTPSFPQGEPVQNGDAGLPFNNHDGQIASLYQLPPYITPNYVYNENTNFNGDGNSFQDNQNSTTETLCSNGDGLEEDTEKIKRNLKVSDEKEATNEEGENDKGKTSLYLGENADWKIVSEHRDTECINNESTADASSNEKSPSTVEPQKPEVSDDTGKIEILPIPEVKYVEKQSHSTQTHSSESDSLPQIQVRIKESHSTQTIPEETFGTPRTNKKGLDLLLSSPEKSDHGSKTYLKNREPPRTISPRNAQEERRFYQRRTEEKSPKYEPQIHENNEIGLKTSYAKKLLDGLENKEGKKTASFFNGVKLISDCINAQTNIAVQSEPLEPNSANKTGLCGKRLSTDKFIPAENKRNNMRVANGNVKNGYERQRHNKNNVKAVNKVNEQFSRYKEKKPIGKVYEKIIDPVLEDIGSRSSGETIANESRSLSEKSSTVSELSSPTELSSGQNTPPEKLIVRKMEQKIVHDLNKSFHEKLKQNLTKNEKNDENEKSEEATKDKVKLNVNVDEVENEEVELDVEAEVEQEQEREREREPGSGPEPEPEREGEKEEEEKIGGKEEEDKTKNDKESETTKEYEIEATGRIRQREKKKSRGKRMEQEPKEKAKTNRSKRKKKGTEEKVDAIESDESIEDKLFLHVYGKAQDFLNKTWENMSKEKVEPIFDLESIFAAENKEVLETLGLKDKWKVPKLPLSSDLLLFHGFGHERPKQKFEDFFASAALKQLQNDMFTKTNITNMRSTRPEEFFASVVEHPTKDAKKNEKKENLKTGKKFGKTSEVEISTKKKSTKLNLKEQKENLKSREGKLYGENQKNGIAHEEAKLGIVDAVNNWLLEQDDPEKLLSVDAINEMSKEGKDEGEPKQKNGLGNPLHASSVEGEIKSEKCLGEEEEEEKEENACKRVARNNGVITAKDENRDGCDGRDGRNGCNGHTGHPKTEKLQRKEKKFARLYRSSSWDAKLSELHLKKRFKFLTETSSWDRRKLKDAALRKHLKFITDSATFCHDLIGDVRNGYEFAKEELCDPKQSVSKYYTLSPSVLDPSEKSNEIEAFDALEYKFLNRNLDITGNVPVTDSGVHSDTESNEGATTPPASLLKYPLPNKEVSCKMQ